MLRLLAIVEMPVALVLFALVRSSAGLMDLNVSDG